MDIYRLVSDLKFVNQIGKTLNLDEKLKLELSLPKINEENKYDQVLFWGKIEGSGADYYIALALQFQNFYEFPHKTFFYSSSDFNFLELPYFNQEYKAKVETLRTPFTGKKETILVQVTNPEDQQNPEGGEQLNPDDPNYQPPKPPDSDEEEEIKVPPKNFTELDRLAYIVRAIESECQVIPIGAYKLTPSHELRPNNAFVGLTKAEGFRLDGYQHFRNPVSEEKKEYISRGDVLFKFDFFDTLYTDLPKGCWSIQSDASKTVATIRSLSWPGYLSYHKLNTEIFGGVYMGDGIKNVDLPFMIL